MPCRVLSLVGKGFREASALALPETHTLPRPEAHPAISVAQLLPHTDVPTATTCSALKVRSCCPAVHAAASRSTLA